MNAPAAAGEPVVELRGVAKTYPSTPPVRALQPTDLTIWAGQYLAIVGPSGSGKSTLMNLLGLIDRPTAGTMVFRGIDTCTATEKVLTRLRAQAIGFVFQAFHLVDYRTAWENVTLGQLYTGVRLRARRARAAECLAAVGLAHRMDVLPSTLSGGEKQRVAIARAIMNQPDLLLCDEPTGNLDTGTTCRIMDLLQALNDTGITVVTITHDPAVAARAGRRIQITDGRVTETTPAAAARQGM